MEGNLNLLLDSVQDNSLLSRMLPDFSNDIAFRRQKAAEILLHLSESYSLDGKTLVHAFVLLDQFISSSMLLGNSLNSLDQIAVACFMISVKFRETLHPTLSDLRQLTTFDCEVLAKREEEVITALGWNIYLVSGALYMTTRFGDAKFLSFFLLLKSLWQDLTSLSRS